MFARFRSVARERGATLAPRRVSALATLLGGDGIGAEEPAKAQGPAKGRKGDHETELPRSLFPPRAAACGQGGQSLEVEPRSRSEARSNRAREEKEIFVREKPLGPIVHWTRWTQAGGRTEIEI